ncbi:hypothetical protein ACHAXR_009783 [Thalassiosira sp. AJA248-18]
MSSLSRPFEMHHEGGEDGASPLNFFNTMEDQRKQQWKNFVSNLEDECSDDSAEEDIAKKPTGRGGGAGVAVGSTNDRDPPNGEEGKSSLHPGSANNSLYMQQLRGGFYMGDGKQDETAARPPIGMPSTLPLRDWIGYYASNNNQTTLSHMTMGKRIDKSYLEKATRVALSLANKLDEHYGGTGSEGAMHEKDVIIENVVVIDTDSEAVGFVCASSPSDSPQHSSQQGQRPVIYSLGRIYYEMFSQGLSCQSTSSSEPSSFDILKVADEDADSASDVEHDKRKQPRRETKGETGRGHYSALQLAGLPSSLCQIVADMLENFDDDGSGGLFRSDTSVASLSDVISDLQQMVDEPNSFLHDSLLMRMEPIIPDKLYGRNDELHQCLEIADKVFQCERKSNGIDHSQSTIMISGFSGCGKSSIVKEVSHVLEEKGWRCLQCKFDQEVRPQPLSIIATAFDIFLLDITCKLDNGGRQEVKKGLDHMLGDRDITTLCQLIPTLGKLMPVNDACSKPNKILFNSGDAAASKCRLHRLFGLLAKALSNQSHPLFISFDDLQWADPASIDLINSLVHGIIYDDSSEEPMSASGGTHMLVVGCYRSDEVTYSDPLATCIQQMKDCSTITLKEIHLEGLSSEDVNALVSDSLFYPRRLTRSLANLIHQKSAGSPLFVKEFLSSLATENLLTYSLSKHKWQFDEDLIQLKTVSDGVADLLARRLERIPDDALSGLQIMSCLGSEVSLEILLHLRNVCGNTDVIAGLDSATENLLIKKKPTSYSFVHDMIQQTVYQGINQQTRVRMLKEIADTVIARTPDTRTDAVLFVIVDLVNRFGPENTSSREDRALYAQFNLSAGEKSRNIPDFASARLYLESGISFLDAGYWTHHYSLSLALFKNAARVHWVLGKTNLMTNRINEVIGNAKCFEDKLDSMNVLIRSLTIDGTSIEKAFEHCFAVLEYLGEQFPKDLDGECIRSELVDTNAKLQQLLPESLYKLPIMEDVQKKEAMKFLSIASYLSYRQKNRYLPLLVCRMVRLTMSHGRCAMSSTGLAGMAICFARRNVTIAYELGKVAMILNKSPECFSPEVTFYVLAVVNVWKEPWQASLPPLLDSHKMAMKCGEIATACSMSESYQYRSFVFGSSLSSLENGQIYPFLGFLARHKRIAPYLSTMPTLNAISDLTGRPQRNVWEGIRGLEDDDSNLSNAFNKKDISRAVRIVSLQLMLSFIFRRMGNAERLVRQYQEFFNLHEAEEAVVAIMRAFYSGLIALHCLRESKDQYWMDIALNASRAMETWAEGCKWNFENKALLLSAEYHFSIGEFDKAADEYHLSIASAHEHRFVHEEAIGNELAAYFHLDRGREDLSNELMTRAIECYQSWGAEKKARSLLHAKEH